MGEIIDLPKEYNPAVVSCIMIAHLFESIVPLLLRLNWQKLLEIILGRCTHQVIQLLSPIQNIIRRMRIRETSKFVPNSFYHSSEPTQQFEVREAFTPFRPIDNCLNKNSKKSNRKSKAPKKFLEDEQHQCSSRENVSPQNILGGKSSNVQLKELEQKQQSNNQLFCAVNKKSNLLLHFDLEDSSEPEEEKYQQVTHSEPIQDLMTLPAFRNFDKLQLMDWSNSSDEDDNETESKKTPKLVPQIKMTPPITITKQSIFQRVDKSRAIQCLLRRDKKSVSGLIEYNIYLKDSLQHIVTVRKEGLWKYCIYLREKGLEDQFFKYTKMATLQSSFLGNKFTLIKENEKYSNLTICYETNIFGLSGPRKFYAYLPKGQLSFEYLHQCYENSKYRDQIEKVVSRTAKWSQKSQSYVLDFHGRANEASIKNFLVTDLQEHEDKNFIIFGKAGPDVYNLDIRSPFSLVQGIAVALTTFQRKITCD